IIFAYYWTWGELLFEVELLRTDVRGDFNIHGTKISWDAIYHQKSKIYNVLSILKLWLRFLSPFLIEILELLKKKKSREKIEIEIFQYFFVPMASGVSGMDTSNN
ncbi:MAG: hypothetical protein GY694_05800, partial [Gammaproteobacteria bacterium]|nr:hypothetical protein [Gammaproteobacteria bacterium]